MNTISSYFNAEKFESLFFIGIGSIALLVGLYFIFYLKTPFSRGFAIPLILVALIQVVVGTTVYVRSPKDISRVESMLERDNSKIQTEEIPRMEVVMKNFVIYRYVEIALIILGLLLMFVLKNTEFAQGIGIGLFIQATLMLSLDFFAEKRGGDYLQYLLSLSLK